MYTEEYYKSMNYSDYLAREGRYRLLVEDVLDLMNKLCVAPDTSKPILDFGCAVGFTLEALLKEGYDCEGVDVSDWALEQAEAKGLCVSKELNCDKKYSSVFALDVLEHLHFSEVHDLLDCLKTDTMIVRIPVCAREGEDYVYEESRQDPTHIIRWTTDKWESLFRSYNYKVIPINLPSIWNSEGVLSAILIKGQ